jgi:hypothetical protein
VLRSENLFPFVVKEVVNPGRRGSNSAGLPLAMAETAARWGDMSADPRETALKACEEKVRQLSEENEHLRESALLFGDLAERLNASLDRRRGMERRSIPRNIVDRRQTANSK